MTKATKQTKAPDPANTLTGLSGWIEVFKAGAHTANNGKQCSFSQADLDQMVANHALGAAPAVLGHPKHDDPAYAWVGGMKREGDSLFAKFENINPAFEAGIASGAYRNRSVNVYPDKANGWRVRHVGWLGAVPPAIDGLSPVTFSADDADCLEFSAPGYSLVWGLECAASLLRNLRDKMIEKDGLEAADLALPQYRLDSMNEAVNTARSDFNTTNPVHPSLFNQPTGDAMSFTQADLDAAAAKAKKEAEDAAAVQFAATNSQLLTLQSERQAERLKLQIGAWTAAGKVLPAEAAGMAEFMAALEDQGAEFSFSKAEGGEDKKTPAQFFTEFMAARAPVVKLGGRKDDAPEAGVDVTSSAALAGAAQTYMKEQSDKGITVSASEAVAHVSTKGAV